MTSQPTGRDESAILRRVGVDLGVPRPLGDPRSPRRRPGRTARSKRDVPIRLALWRMAVAHAAPLGRPFTERAGETAASALGERRGGRYMARSGSRFGAATPGASRVASESPRTRPARGSHPRGRGGGMTKPGFRAPQAHLDDRDETRRRRATPLFPSLATLLARKPQGLALARGTRFAMDVGRRSQHWWWWPRRELAACSPERTTSSVERRGRRRVLFARDHRRKHRRDVSRLVSHDLERVTVADR